MWSALRWIHPWQILTKIKQTKKEEEKNDSNFDQKLRIYIDEPKYRLTIVSSVFLKNDANIKNTMLFQLTIRKYQILHENCCNRFPSG